MAMAILIYPGRCGMNMIDNTAQITLSAAFFLGLFVGLAADV